MFNLTDAVLESKVCLINCFGNNYLLGLLNANAVQWFLWFKVSEKSVVKYITCWISLDDYQNMIYESSQCCCPCIMYDV